MFRKFSDQPTSVWPRTQAISRGVTPPGFSDSKIKKLGSVQIVGFVSDLRFRALGLRLWVLGLKNLLKLGYDATPILNYLSPLLSKQHQTNRSWFFVTVTGCEVGVLISISLQQKAHNFGVTFGGAAQLSYWVGRMQGPRFRI